MKKSTGILILLTFLACTLIVIGIVITLLVYIMQGTAPTLFSGKHIALVRIEGVIYNVEDWIDEIEGYAEDSSISAIVIRVDSPGGAVGPSQELYDAIRDAKEKRGKVVVASFGSVAASGGYYISCGANEIFTSPGALTGSIGVYAKFLKTKELFEKIGIDYETVKAGDYKNFGAMERGLSEEEREMMQHVIDDTYHQFIEAVLQGRTKALTALYNTFEPDDTTPWYPFTAEVRKLIREYQNQRDVLIQTREKEQGRTDDIDSATETLSPKPSAEKQPDELYKPDVRLLKALAMELAEGKVYTGRQALEVGLVDGVGSLDDAIDRAALLAGIPGDVSVIEKKQTPLTWFDLLTQKVAALASQQKSYSPLEYKFPY